MAKPTRPAPRRAEGNRKSEKPQRGAATEGRGATRVATAPSRSPRPGRPVTEDSRSARPTREPRSAAGSPEKPGRRPRLASSRPGAESASPERASRPSRSSEGRPRVAGRPATRTGTPERSAALRKSAPRPKSSAIQGQDRLQKILAHAGVASRRACEEMILEGRVQVNGVTITELGAKADPRRDEITLDLQPIRKEAPVYILVNKPKGYVTTVKDEQGRPTVMALIHGVEARVYPVGRLDFQSEGLLLMTNDGEMAQRLTSPDYHIPKIYLVKVHRMPRPETLDEMREGFRLDGRRLKPCAVELYDKQDNPWLKVTLIEGKNQQIRKMFAAVGHPVHKLRRIQFGPLDDPFLKPGEWRFLNPQELAALKSL